MPKSELERVFHAPRWIAGGLSVFAVAAAIASFYLYRSEGLSLESAIAAASALLAVLGVADSLTTAVRLYTDSLSITTNFRRRAVPLSWRGGGMKSAVRLLGVGTAPSGARG